MANRTGQEPAFPYDPDYQMEKRDNIVSSYELSKGMSKRFYVACAAMQGMIIRNGIRTSQFGCIEQDFDEVDKNIIEASYRIADELLRQENQ